MLSRKGGEVLAVVVSALILAAGGTALAADLLSSSSGYTGCLSQNGDLVKFAAGDSPLKPCTGNQVQVHLSSGELANVAAGTGLVESTNGDVVTLSIDPTYQLPQGCVEGDIPMWNGEGWSCTPSEPGPLPQ
jgi:hypothetical protein